MRRLALVLLALGALALAGPGAIGRLLLLGGAPGLAAPLLADPVAKGVALYRAGDYAGADAAFAKAGRSQTYNRGLSLAATGQYPLSVAYFDAVLFVNPADADARRNRELVATMYPPDQGVSIAPGRIQGAGGLGEGDKTAQSTPGIQDPETQRPIDAKGIVASDDWLATLPDDPGEFLKLRLRAEYERRAEQGLVRPREAEPW
ncbi:hypothetical protein [Paracoccus aminophilus]|uniref:Ca-activated chloride channel family protein n=1 Tax=Paracoccus aminophilus JCM 7686 TaxID=1367847 RepID=S5YFY0_PARAH|nr:hypothetical protein [Paracoccus aminophilus]AGT10373.1 hypothetical protein JCM7686_3338 [Paracoccus aminophilus JCM 7686]